MTKPEVALIGMASGVAGGALGAALLKEVALTVAFAGISVSAILAAIYLQVRTHNRIYLTGSVTVTLENEPDEC